VLLPKVEGTLALEKVLQEHPEAFLVTFASVNGFFGGLGVSAYAAANGFLLGFAEARRETKPHQSQSLLWSMWDDLGMSRNYGRKDLSRARGYFVIPTRAGTQFRADRAQSSRWSRADWG
jgi:hypothetical protein